MLDEIIRSIPVFISSMIKFIFGPLGGFAAKLHILTTIIVTVAGMMTSVVSFTYFGKFLRERVLSKFFQKTKKQDEVKNKKWLGFFSKYGLTGIAFLTPLILTPIGGTLLAVGFGSPKEKIILYMFISAVFWAIFFTVIVYFFGHKAVPEFVR